MNKIIFLSIMLLILGFIFLASGLFIGELEAGFVLIFPFVKGSGIFALVSVLLIFGAILLFMIGIIWRFSSGRMVSSDESGTIQKERNIYGGGIIFIGPIPIVFGSNLKFTIGMIALSIIMIIILMVVVLL